MNMNIGGKKYTLEYTFEAAMNTKCVDNTFAIMTSAFIAPDGEADQRTQMKQMISGIANMPMLVMENFYAGLLENHADEVQSIDDAKILYKQYMKENKDDEKATFYGLQAAITAQMESDGFFKQIGLEEMFQPKKTTKAPANRKKKAPTKAQKVKTEEQNLSVVE